MLHRQRRNGQSLDRFQGKASLRPSLVVAKDLLLPVWAGKHVRDEFRICASLVKPNQCYVLTHIAGLQAGPSSSNPSDSCFAGDAKEDIANLNLGSLGF